MIEIDGDFDWWNGACLRKKALQTSQCYTMSLTVRCPTAGRDDRCHRCYQGFPGIDVNHASGRQDESTIQS